MGDRIPHEMNEEIGPFVDFGHLPAVWWCVGCDCGWVEGLCFVRWMDCRLGPSVAITR